MKWNTHDLTLTQFWHPPTPPEVNRAQWQHDTLARFGRRESWGGMPKAECLALPAQGWPAGVDAALRLLAQPELAAVGESRLRRRWSADDGETVDYARALDGMPCWVQPFRAPGGSGGRIKTLVAHAGGNCNVTAEEIAWKAYAAVRYVDAMESVGYRVDVDVSFAARRAYSDGSGWACTVHVKQPDDPLDLSQLAAVLSAAAFRWYGFTWQAAVNVKLDSARGSDHDLRPDDPEAVYLPAHVTDRASAQSWLESANAEGGD